MIKVQKLGADLKSWYDAEALCNTEATNAHLITIDNGTDKTLVKGHDYFHFGLIIDICRLGEWLVRQLLGGQ